MSERPDLVALADGEQVLWHGRPSMYPVLSTISKGLAIAAIGVVVLLVAIDALVLGPAMPSSAPATLIGGLLVALGVLTSGWRALSWSNTQYLFTTETVYQKRRFPTRTVSSRDLDSVQNVTVTRSGLGRTLSFGDVQIDTLDDTETLILRNVPDPERAASRMADWADEQSTPS